MLYLGGSIHHLAPDAIHNSPVGPLQSDGINDDMMTVAVCQNQGCTPCLFTSK